MDQAHTASSSHKYNAFFASRDADFIIRAANGTLFRVSRLVLTTVSGFFNDMFQLPQPARDENNPDIVDGLPVVSMDESERTLEILFTLCYPMAQPELKDIREVLLVLKAALKYDMDFIATRLREIWPAIAASDPLRAFAVACANNLHEEAAISAKLCLREPIWPLQPPLPSDFKDIYAETLLRLQAYHRECAIAASNCASDAAWCDAIYSAAMCKHCQGPGWTILTATKRLHWGDWYRGYTRRAAKTLLSRPSSCAILEDSIVYQSMNASRCSAMTVHEYETMQSTVKAFSEGIEKVIVNVKLDLHM